jgi:hypothetical protein
MKRALFLITIGLSLFLSQFVSASQPPSETVLKKPPLALEKANTEDKVRLSKNYGKIPLAFEANEGQTDEQVKFLSRGSGYSLFLKPTEAVLSLSKDDRSTAIRMGLVGANSKIKMAGEEKLPGKTNYLIGNDPKKWHTHVSNYKKVRYEEVYPGIDLVYYGNQRKLEYDFIVKPGVDPNAIRMQFAGVDSMSVEAGDLVMHTESGDVTQKAPIIYQEINGKRKKIMGNYMFLADNQVGFYLSDYDKTQPLVIDPVLEYSTYLGGNDHDRPHGITVDTAGNAYITGITFSEDFSTTAGSLQPSDPNPVIKFSNAFVTKLNPSGTALVFSTYLGGVTNTSQGWDVAVDDSNNVYVLGVTTAVGGTDSFPITAGAFQTVHSQSSDFFITKLNPTGSEIVYSTFLGGDGSDGIEQAKIEVDLSGNAYIAGKSDSFDFPTTAGAFQTSLSEPDFIARDPRFRNRDTIVAKLNPSGSDLIFSTYLGGNDFDEFRGLAVDISGNVFVSGITQSTNFPTTNGAFQTSHAGGAINGFLDYFVTKINSTGTELLYSTYLGGSNVDGRKGGIAIDRSGNAYIVGQTNSQDFPTTPGAFQTQVGGNAGFVTKLDPTGSNLVYSTFLGGGNGSDKADLIEVDQLDNAIVAGGTNSSDFPIVDPFQTAILRGIFVSKLNPTGSGLIFSSILGGEVATIQGLGMALDSSGNVYVSGQAFAGKQFPITPGAFQTVIDASLDNSDGFVSKINNSSAPVLTANAGPDQTVDEGDLVTLDGTGSTPDPNTLNFDWNQVAGPAVTLDLNDPAHPTFAAPYVSSNQTLTFELIVDDGTNFSDPDTVNVTVVSVNSPPEADAGNDSTIKPGAVATLDGSNSFDPESDPITYSWTQVGGTIVTLDLTDPVHPTFTAPNAVGDVLIFKLQVSDGKESSTPSTGTDSAETDTVAITIVANSQPVADAGPDQTKDEGSVVTLAGSGSDADGGDILSFQWTQTGGPAVTLSSTTVPSPTFTAPTVGPGGVDITLQLVVSDDDPVNPLSSIADEVVIHVANINDPPNCVAANASLDLGWPPTHKMELVEVQNLADPEGDGVTIVINSVTQDEPVSGLSNGDSSPDAVIQPGDPADNVLLRLERDPQGNGRVYEVNFTASDGFESCNGTIEVTVPKSRQSGAVDDGQNFDSILP